MEGTMRKLLDAIYLGSGALAGVFLILIAILSLMQIVGRLLGFAAHSFDEFAGYCMAASSFLGLAHTFRRNEHIRVSLLVDKLKGKARRGAEILCLAATLSLLLFFTCYAIEMTWFSFRFNDVSQGLVPVSLWIPQSGMALGLALMTLALADDLLVAMAGGEASYLAVERNKPIPMSENI
jgi:TRAP-type C4-dicarboxylate transport system permease small subunit